MRYQEGSCTLSVNVSRRGEKLSCDALKYLRMTFLTTFYFGCYSCILMCLYVRKKRRIKETTIHFLLCFMATSGAFKFRGACNAVFSLDDDDASKGVVTHSRFAMSSYFRGGYVISFYFVKS